MLVSLLNLDVTREAGWSVTQDAAPLKQALRRRSMSSPQQLAWRIYIGPALATMASDEESEKCKWVSFVSWPPSVCQKRNRPRPRPSLQVTGTAQQDSRPFRLLEADQAHETRLARNGEAARALAAGLGKKLTAGPASKRLLENIEDCKQSFMPACEVGWQAGERVTSTSQQP